MGFQPVPNTSQVTLLFWNGASYSANILHFKTPLPLNEEGMTDLAANVRGWYANTLNENAPSGIFLAKIMVRDLTVQNGVGIEYTSGLPLPGEYVAPSLPMNVTVAVKWSTGRTGRSYRGRSYHVGLAVDDVEGDLLLPVKVTQLTAHWSALLAVKLTSGVGDWVVVSRWSNLLPRAAGVTTPITGCSIDPTLDSQRRRLLGRGN